MNFFIIYSCLLGISLAQEDTICVGRSTAGDHNPELQSTQVPGIYGAGMTSMMIELHQKDFRRPILVISNERANVENEENSDIYPGILRATETCSVNGFGIISATLCKGSGCFVSNFTCTKEESNEILVYTGLDDYSKIGSLRSYKGYIHSVIEQMGLHKTIDLYQKQVTTSQTICQTGSFDVSVQLGFNGKTSVVGFFSKNLQKCRVEKDGSEEQVDGKEFVIQNVATFKTDCYYTCNYFVFTDYHSEVGENPRVAMQPAIGSISNKAEVDANYPVNVAMPATMPDDGSAQKGSVTLQRLFGGPPNKGEVWNSKCEMYIGSTNITVGVYRSEQIFPDSYGECPHIISQNVRIPMVPMKYATRQYINGQEMHRQKRSLRLPNWAAGLLGGILGGPGGAVLGLYLNGAFVTMADVDLAIEKRVGPALEQVNMNFKRQSEINKQLFDYEKIIAENVKKLSDEQISLQMEMHAMSIIMSLADYTEQKATELKAQLKAYAYANHLKWNDATGCITFDHPCDIECLEHVSNTTQGVITNITNTDLPDFGKVTLGPEVGNQIDRNTAGMTIMGVIIGLIIIVMILACCCFAVRR